MEKGCGIECEFEGVTLGDKRLERRLIKIATAMDRAPQESFVEQASDVAALEGTYRFLSNERVRPEAVFEGHIQRTVERASKHPTVLVLHDTTEFRFGGTKERRGLGRISTQKREGFLAHYSVCVSPEGEPLGTVGVYAWSRLNEGKKEKGWGDLLDPERESLRWCEAAELASARLYGATSAIHVMDREGDQFGLFAELLTAGERFVIRLGHDRRLRKGRGRDGTPMLNEALAQTPLRFRRSVRLGKRERERATKKQKIFPERGARNATLEIRAASFDLHRSHQHPGHLPQSIPLNFVEVQEVGAPEGASPINWRIVTTEPIVTDEQIATVIDIYRKRWLIEEFFKAIKTGCQFEAHQLENIRGLLIALSIESVIAWKLLLLRHLERGDPDASGEQILTDEQRIALCHIRARRGLSSEHLTVRDVISELAVLGSHLKNNGPPGWVVLKRGLRKLEILAEGISLMSNKGALLGDVINL
jgi:Transposase DNA-binding/Transposase DDE domain